MNFKSGADWIGQPEPTRRLDPGLFWAEATGWAGYHTQNDGRMRMAVELSIEPPQRRQQANYLLKQVNQGKAQVSSHWYEALSNHKDELLPRFLTMRLPLNQLSSVAAHVARLKPGFVGNAEDYLPTRVPPVTWPDDGQVLRALASGADLEVACLLRQALDGSLAQWSLPPQKPTNGALKGPNVPQNPLIDVLGGASVRFQVPKSTLTQMTTLQVTGLAPPVLDPKCFIGVIDFGCPFAHSAFQRPFNQSQPGGTRIRYFWDQGRPASLTPQSPTRPPWKSLGKDFAYGREADKAALDELVTDTRSTLGQLKLPVDQASVERACYALAGLPELLAPDSHGAHVLDIAAGGGLRLDQVSNAVADAASQADILFVQLPDMAVRDLSGGWLATYVIDAMEYIVTRARELDPAAQLVINLSYGHFAGSHDGHSLLEAAMDAIADPKKGVTIVLAAGNQPSDGRFTHISGQLQPKKNKPGSVSEFDWHVAADGPSQSLLELWYRSDSHQPVRLTVTSPDGHTTFTLTGQGAEGHKGPKAATSTGVAALLMPNCLAGGKVGASLSTSGKGGRGASGMALIAVAPTRTEPPPAGWRALAQAGAWRIKVENLEDTPLSVDAWVERNEPGRVIDPASGQSHLSSVSGPLKPTRLKTMTALCYGRKSVVVQGVTLDAATGKAAGRYAESGRGDGRRMTLCAPAARKVDNFRRGLLAAGNLGSALVEKEGTSMAAPWAARLLFDDLVGRTSTASPMNTTRPMKTASPIWSLTQMIAPPPSHDDITTAPGAP